MTTIRRAGQPLRWVRPGGVGGASMGPRSFERGKACLCQVLILSVVRTPESSGWLVTVCIGVALGSESVVSLVFSRSSSGACDPRIT